MGKNTFDERKKHILRPRFFDVSRLAEAETWFQDMSAEGYHIKGLGSFWITFEKGEPRTVHYRFTACDENAFKDEIPSLQPAGWEFVDQDRGLAVYAWAGETVPCDEDVITGNQWDLLNEMARGHVRSAFASTLLLLAMLISQYKMVSNFHKPVISILNRDLLLYVLIDAYLMYAVVRSLLCFKAVRQWQTQVENRKLLRERKPWKKIWNRGICVTTLVLVLVVGPMLISFGLMLSSRSPLPEKTPNLPIVRLQDIERDNTLVSERTLFSEMGMNLGNHLNQDFSLLAPVQYSLYESKTSPKKKWLNSVQPYTPSLSEDYYRLLIPAMGKGLMEDLISQNNVLYPGKPFVEIHRPGFDQLRIRKMSGSLEVTGQKGSVVFYVGYFGDQDKEETLDRILQKIR